MNLFVALIPIRSGSKGIPKKNIKIINGKPLVSWVIYAASNCNEINEIFIATDSDEFAELVITNHNDVNIFERSIKSSTDNAQTEEVMIEFSKKHQFENIILIQATSPLLDTEYLQKGINMFKTGKYDSILSVIRNRRFFWNIIDKNEKIVAPINYNPKARPRRQEVEGALMENGAFYITSRNRLLKTKCRLSGNIGFIEMPEYTSYEIDELYDWVIMEQLLKKYK